MHDFNDRGTRREGGIGADEVRVQLERILQSEAFERSDRLAAFLRYIVERKLTRNERIREIDLALDVFGRGGNFDSRTDPIVRVEAGRLRKALSAYYGSAGADDSLIISVPPRGYTPRFQWQKSGEHTNSSARYAQKPIRTTTAGPSIAVLPFVNMTNEEDRDVFCQGVTEELINALTGIDEFKVASRTSAYQFKDRAVDLRSVGKELGVQTIVEGSIRADGERLRVTAQLSSSDDGFHLWSQTFDAVLTEPFDVQENLGRAMSLAIAEQLRTS